MKLFCINEDGWGVRRKFLKFLGQKQINGPKYGDIVTSLGDCWEEGVFYYIIKEWPPCDEDNAWEAECFIPISELEEEVEEEEINLKIKS